MKLVMGEHEKQQVTVLPKTVNINKLTGIIETAKIVVNNRREPLEIRHLCDDIYTIHKEGKMQNLGFISLDSEDEI